MPIATAKGTKKANLSSVQQNVRKEVNTIATVYARVSKNRKSARAFLKKAGILTSKGHLAPEYR
jgi:aminoglycoside/choline kinase family phosphotransferase